jgi:hypothetical protein
MGAVVEGGILLGVVSIADLVKWLITAQRQTISQLHNYIIGLYTGESPAKIKSLLICPALLMPKQAPLKGI